MSFAFLLLLAHVYHLHQHWRHTTSSSSAAYMLVSQYDEEEEEATHRPHPRAYAYYHPIKEAPGAEARAPRWRAPA